MTPKYVTIQSQDIGTRKLLMSLPLFFILHTFYYTLNSKQKINPQQDKPI